LRTRTISDVQQNCLATQSEQLTINSKG
jgi:hypothetical protein